MNSERPNERTEARQRHTRWPGWIWAIPLAALGIVAWLGIHSFLIHGASVTVTFSSVAGMNTDADVRYRGLKIGRVSDLQISDDGKKVIATLSIDSSVENLLRQGTRFWIAGANPGLENLSALKNVFAGPYIDMDPGLGKPIRHFTGLEQPPIVTSGTEGSTFILEAKKLGSLERNAHVNYLGLQVGTVESTKLTPDGDHFAITIFVRAPYDKLIRTTSKFWNENAIQVAMGAGGIEVHFASLGAVTAGAISFETLDRGPPAPSARPNDHFVLYADKETAQDAPIGAGVRFISKLDGLPGNLKSGAPVKLRGFRIGQVIETSLDYDAVRHALETPVVIEIDPARLNLQGVTPPSDGNWSSVIDDMMGQLVAEGLRASIDRNPPFIGGAEVVLAIDANAAPAMLAKGGAWPEIPASGTAGIDELTAQAGDVMKEIRNLPLGKIADDLHAITDRLRHIVSSPEIEDSITHLDRSLANIDRETAAARGKIGPLVKNLNHAAAAAESTANAANHMLTPGVAAQGKSLPETIGELTRAARAVRELADYLDRHPEAIIQGRSGGQ